MTASPVRVLVPAGMLGAGFTAESISRLPEIRAVKISFPRPTTQGGRHDRDMHAGQQHIPISQLAQPPEHKRAC
jgi:Domain of unknown function (DUF4387)